MTAVRDPESGTGLAQVAEEAVALAAVVVADAARLLPHLRPGLPVALAMDGQQVRDEEAGHRQVRDVPEQLGRTIERDDLHPAAAILQRGDEVREVPVARNKQDPLQVLRLLHGVEAQRQRGARVQEDAPPVLVGPFLHRLLGHLVSEVAEDAAEVLLAAAVAVVAARADDVVGNVQVHPGDLGTVAGRELAQHVVAHAVAAGAGDVRAVHVDPDASIGQGNGHGGLLFMLRVGRRPGGGAGEGRQTFLLRYSERSTTAVIRATSRSPPMNVPTSVSTGSGSARTSL